MLEHETATVLRETGLGARMDREGLAHDGLFLQFAGAAHRIDLKALTGRNVMVYGQHEVVKDLIAARLEDGEVIRFRLRGCRRARHRHGSPRDPLQPRWRHA